MWREPTNTFVMPPKALVIRIGPFGSSVYAKGVQARVVGRWAKFDV